MLSFTLDTNCIIALDELQSDQASHRRSEAEAVQKLIVAHSAAIADVAVVAISASERQRDNSQLEDFSVFEDRIGTLGMEKLNLLHPMMYNDVTFWDASLWVDEEMLKFEASIHDILFSNIPFSWSDYCAANEIADVPETPDRKWRNAKCDVQAFWTHAWHKRDVFVTSDINFHTVSKKARLISLAGGRIETPISAAGLLVNSQNAT
jgi:hypothetical protein